MSTTSTQAPAPRTDSSASPVTPSRPVTARRRSRKLIRNWWGFLLLVAAALMFVIPLYMLVTTAFKTNSEVYAWPPRLLP
ncbi:MAG: hypothetical protein ACTHU7_14215, partial [Microbacterium sp.]